MVSQHATVPLDYGNRVKMQAPGPPWAESPIWGAGFDFYVGHTFQSFEPGDTDIQSLIWGLVRDEIRPSHGCTYPPDGLPSDRGEPTLYRITRKKLRVYDDFTSIVVRARCLDEAREAAFAFVEQEALKYHEERFDRIWSDPEKTEIERIRLEDGPQVISAEFRHG